MSDSTSRIDDHEQLVVMLPWFVNQTLAADERQKVADHVDACGECRDEVAFLSSLNRSVQSDAQIAYDRYADVDKNLSGVMARIDADEQAKIQDPVAAAPALSTLIQQVKDRVLSVLSSPQMQWGASAIAAVLVAVLGFQMFNDQSDKSYSVLSSPESGVSVLRLAIELAPAQEWAAIQALIEAELGKKGQAIAVELSTDDQYVILVNEAIGIEALSGVIVDLESQDAIKSVELVP